MNRNEAPQPALASIGQVSGTTWLAATLLALAWGIGYWLGDILFFVRAFGDSPLQLLIDPVFALELVGATFAGCAAAAYALALALVGRRGIGWWVPAVVFVGWTLVGFLPESLLFDALPTTITLTVVGGGLGLVVGFGLRPKSEGGGCSWSLLATAAWAPCGPLGFFATRFLQRWFFDYF